MREYWLLGLLLGCFHCQLVSAQAPATSSPGVAAVPVDHERHHRVVLQNAGIRVLEGLVLLNDTTPMHIHAANSVVVFLSHSRFGIQLAGEPPVITEVKAGDMRYSAYGDHPVTHTVWDEGPEDFHFYVVEVAASLPECDTCAILTQPGLGFRWRKGGVTAYGWKIAPGEAFRLPASAFAWLLIDLTKNNTLDFCPPRHALAVKGYEHGNAQFILLQLPVQ